MGCENRNSRFQVQVLGQRTKITALFSWIYWGQTQGTVFSLLSVLISDDGSFVPGSELLLCLLMKSKRSGFWLLAFHCSLSLFSVLSLWGVTAETESRRRRRRRCRRMGGDRLIDGWTHWRWIQWTTAAEGEEKVRRSLRREVHWSGGGRGLWVVVGGGGVGGQWWETMRVRAEGRGREKRNKTSLSLISEWRRKSLKQKLESLIRLSCQDESETLTELVKVNLVNNSNRAGPVVWCQSSGPGPHWWTQS